MNHFDEAHLEIAVCDWLNADPLGSEHVRGPHALCGRGTSEEVEVP